MPDINNFRQLDFQETGEPSDNDRVLVVEVENDKAVGAKNYDLSKLKGHISADALAYLEECRSIEASVSDTAETVNNIAAQSEILLETTRGETIESLKQTVTSTEPGGVNVFTITQKNGTQNSLQVQNGLNGPQGPQGKQGPAVPLVQETGTSTTDAMSQDAVTKELNQLKNSLVNKDDVLSYEEIMASTDLTGKVASANALKTFSTNISEQIGNINYIPKISSSILGSSNTEDYFQKWCNYVYTNYKDKLNKPIISFVSPNSNGIVIGNIYVTGETPSYAGLLYIHYAEGLYYFGYNNGVWHWRNI